MTIPATEKTRPGPLQSRHSLTVSIAASVAETEQCLRLRHRVFAEEMGASLETLQSGLDVDYFDAHARHMMVTDNDSGRVVATTRLLTNKSARRAGSFYSQTEFDIKAVLALNRRFLEVGRTCVAQSHRNGAALSLLWRGISRIVMMEDIDYLIGCASIPMQKSFSYAHSIMRHIRQRHFADEALRVYPKRPLPQSLVVETTDVILPTLLKGYLRLGSRICGEACYDEDFNVADVFILLDADNVIRRYQRHVANQ